MQSLCVSVCAAERFLICFELRFWWPRAFRREARFLVARSEAQVTGPIGVTGR